MDDSLRLNALSGQSNNVTYTLMPTAFVKITKPFKCIEKFQIFQVIL